MRPSHIPEIHSPEEPARDYVARLAREKALAVEMQPDELILAADTVVDVASRVLEKPEDAADARRMLRQLSGRPHFVHTGLYLRTAEGTASDVVTTTVHFLELTDADIDVYVASGEPMDKAGAYAVQGRASKFVEKIEGCHFNIVGLPVSRVWQLLQKLSVQ